MTWILIIAAVIFVLGDLIKDGNLEKTNLVFAKLNWHKFGKFMMYVAAFFAIVVLIISIIAGATQKL